ncbi:MAG: DUF1549 and DUF1553 domain-containing protein [Verrucomicrobiales bacterium]
MKSPPWIGLLGIVAAAAALAPGLGAASPAGAKEVTEADRSWWSFQPLRQVAPPPTADAPADRHPIDQLIEAKLDDVSLVPQPTADRRTLLRRASFDLTGLPPTPEELDNFLRDESAEAWTNVIRRLLDSPRYGERWARHWLDVARFAESSGFEHDYDRPAAYHYRDFVIQALNADMPYDQFVQWQIAGDEFEPENPLALMATGFLGAGVFPTQITANEVERTRYDAMDDMLSTTGTAMLGLTIGCARCHDHKIDPIPTRDYYRMLSTFTTTVRSEIELDLDAQSTQQVRTVHAQKREPIAEALRRYESDELPEKFAHWLAVGAPGTPAPTWEILGDANLVSQAGATFRVQDDGSFLTEGTNGDQDVYTVTAVTKSRSLRALRLEALADPSLPKGGPGRADNGNIGLSRLSVWASSAGGPKKEIPLLNPRASFQQNDSHLSVAAALDQNPSSGWAVDPQFGRSHAAVFDFSDPIGTESAITLEIRLEFSVNTRHNIGRPRLAVTSASNPSLEGEAVPAAIAASLAAVRVDGISALTAADRNSLMNWWKTTDPEWQVLHGRLVDHDKQAPQPKLAKVLVCAEGYPPMRMHTQGADFFAETHVLARGSTDLKQEVATPGFLQVLHRHPEEAERRWQWQPPPGARFSGRRRALATWMTDVDHGAGPLVARVIVNRLWQHHFGRGLVTTPNDFGLQGARPSHPDLLEYLADTLVRHGWRLKPVHQLIMTSAAYQRGAGSPQGVASTDPENVWITRRLPRRLEAEAVRDSLLFVSGTLDPTMFGPGTLDSASRRRSVYFTVKRSQMIPALQAFDAPEPLVSQGQRQTTTVAPQALLLMNSPQSRAWAGEFARRFAPDATTSSSQAVIGAYSIALNRLPSAAELADATAFIDAQTDRHRAARAPDPRSLALTDFAQIVLSLNEFIYVD